MNRTRGDTDARDNLSGAGRTAANHTWLASNLDKGYATRALDWFVKASSSLRIAYRLSLCLALMLLLLFTVALVAILGSSTPRQHLRRLVEDANASVVQVSLLREQFSKLEQLTHALENALSPDEVASILSTIRAHQDEAGKILKALDRSKTFADERPSIAQLSSLRSALIDSTERAVAIVTALDRSQATRIVEDQVSPKYVAAAFVLDDMLRSHLRRIELGMEDVNAAAYRQDCTIVVLSVLGAAAAAMLAIGLACGITRPLREAVSFARAVGEGHFVLERSPNNADEMGDLLAALTEMASKVAARQGRLERLSAQDPLTGVYNRRRFEVVLMQEYKRAVRAAVGLDTIPAHTRLCLLLIDVDHFKNFNDRFGHQEGDACLKRIVAAIHCAGLRSTDFLARYGGEEFVVIMPLCAAPEVVAERTRKAVESCAIPTGDLTKPHVTISIGLAIALDPRECTPMRIVKAADDALYEAKAAGRNRWRMNSIGERPLSSG